MKDGCVQCIDLVFIVVFFIAEFHFIDHAAVFIVQLGFIDEDVAAGNAGMVKGSLYGIADADLGLIARFALSVRDASLVSFVEQIEFMYGQSRKFFIRVSI